MSDLTDAVKRAATLPPFPGPDQTRGPDGSYTQLGGDLHRLELHLAAGFPFDMLEFGVRHRIRVLYPQYLLWATLQRIEAAAADQGIPPDSRQEAFGYWTRAYGDPWTDLRARMEWLAITAGVQRVP
jgi:hypothetical protein